MKNKLIVVLILSVCLVLGGCSKVSASVGKDVINEQEILFSQGQNDEAKLYCLDYDNNKNAVADFRLQRASYVADDKYVGNIKGKIYLFDQNDGSKSEICDIKDLVSYQNILMSSDFKNVYFKENMSGIHKYSVDTGSDELIVETDSTSGRFFVSGDQKRFYFMEFANKSQNLYCYDLGSSSKKLIAENVNFFDVSDDESFIVFARSAYSKSEFFYLGLSDGTEKSLFTVSSKAETLDVSDSGNYFLYTTYKTGFFDSNRKYQIHVYNLASGDDQIVYESAEFGDVVGEVTWGKPVN